MPPTARATLASSPLERPLSRSSTSCTLMLRSAKNRCAARVALHLAVPKIWIIRVAPASTGSLPAPEDSAGVKHRRGRGSLPGGGGAGSAGGSRAGREGRIGGPDRGQAGLRERAGAGFVEDHSPGAAAAP